MNLNFIVTNVGRAALVNAQQNGTAPVTIAQCGVSASPLVPVATATALPGEIKRVAALSGDTVADDTIHLVARDESTDAYSVYSFALYLADGTLFAIYGQATPINVKTAASIMMLTIDIKFADIDASAVTFGDANFLNPPATTTVPGVVELATSAEAITGTDAQRAVTPRAMWDAVAVWAPIPPGQIVFGHWTAAPAGFLKCNGAAVSRTTYAALFAAIGTTHGAGDGVSTFNLPDNRGEFLRALDDGRGVDAGRTLGSWQASQNLSHRHPAPTAGVGGAGNYEVAAPAGASSGYANYDYQGGSGAVAYTDYDGGAEARPRNKAYLACIRY